MESPKISIIVPVYNIASYLERCIQSIIQQTFTDFECILINDGSTDLSGELCDKLAQIDERIIVLHKKNGGVSAARNLGLSVARGEYIGFVDGDDIIHNTMYEKLYNAINNYEADVVACDVQGVVEEAVCVESWDDINEVAYSIPTELAWNNLSKRINAARDFSVWTKLIRHTFVQNKSFNKEITITEDMMFLVDVLKENPAIVYVPEKLYGYRIRSNSATRSQATLRNFDEVEATLYQTKACIDTNQNVSLISHSAVVGLHYAGRHLMSIKESCSDEEVRVAKAKYHSLVKRYRRYVSPYLLSKTSKGLKLKLVAYFISPFYFRKLICLLRLNNK